MRRSAAGDLADAPRGVRLREIRRELDDLGVEDPATSTTWSLCCGLDATCSRIMTTSTTHPKGIFAPVSRMGGKRAYADGVIELLGDVPRRFVMVDADPAVVLWWSAVFEGWLGDVAEVIRAAPLDGEELWRAWSTEPTPGSPVEWLARWSVVQAGVHAGLPIEESPAGEWRAGGGRIPAWKYQGDPERSANRLRKHQMADAMARWLVVQKGNFSAKPVTWAGEAWRGVAGYAKISKTAAEWGFSDRFTCEAVARGVEGFRTGGMGGALLVDLNAWAPDVEPGDLVLVDPPYAGTTGYGDVLPRDRIVELAVGAHDAGARVLVHEAGPIAELVDRGAPWRAVELHRTMGGAQNTWRKRAKCPEKAKAGEWVTINFEPMGQRGLF